MEKLASKRKERKTRDAASFSLFACDVASGLFGDVGACARLTLVVIEVPPLGPPRCEQGKRGAMLTYAAADSTRHFAQPQLMC